MIRVSQFACRALVHQNAAYSVTVSAVPVRSLRHTSICFRHSRPFRFTSTSTKSKETSWPSSFRAFLDGSPIVTRPLPFLGRVSIDFGTSMLNFGAVTSLIGFCMTDIMLLRSMSIVGSLCGITYNMTRVPKQLNAVGWGCVFVSVNVAKIIQLLLERREIKFSVEEAALYYRIFEPFGVDARLFKKLMQEAEWKSYNQGGVIVPSGKPLKRVHIFVQGSATTQSGSTGKVMYEYSGTENNGCIVGATAVVDPQIVGRNYPNRIIANDSVRALSFDTRQLIAFIKTNGSTIESAFLHMMYVDLIASLRKHRKTGHNYSSGLGLALHDLKTMLIQACADGKIHPQERRLVREFMTKNDITKAQLTAALESKEIGWTLVEWEDGAKHDDTCFTQSSNRLELKDEKVERKIDDG